MECTSHRCLPHAFLILLHRSSVSADIPGFCLLGEYSLPQFRLVPEQRQICKFAFGAKEHKHSVEMTQPPRSTWLWAQLCNSFAVIFLPQREVEASSYLLSGDLAYTAFVSNYSKVDSFHVIMAVSTFRCVSTCFCFSLISAVEAFVHGYVLAVQPNIWVSANAFLISAPTNRFLSPLSCVCTKLWVQVSQKESMCLSLILNFVTSL